MEAALRFGAHAAQQLSWISLPAGNACRSLASQSAAIDTKTMQILHCFGVPLLDSPAALWANACRAKRRACSRSMQPHRLLDFRSIPSPESSSGLSRYRSAGMRHHAHLDQTGHGRTTPAAGQVFEAAGGATLIDL